MTPRARRRSTGCAIAGIGALAVAVPLASGIPTSSAPPSIAGYPGFQSLLTCRPGTWSPDAQGFTYAWRRQDGSDSIATGQTFRPAQPSLVGYRILCVVAAADASGGTASASSAPILIGPGRTTITIRAKKVQHRKLTITGTVGPLAAVAKTSRGRGQVVAYRQGKSALFQLFGKESLKSNGNFTIIAPDIPGRHTYKVNFNPNEPSLWNPASGTVKVHLKKR